MREIELDGISNRYRTLARNITDLQTLDAIKKLIEHHENRKGQLHPEPSGSPV
ncbi:hypothetical protein ACVILK_001925 [Bradyrhizobium embrapense]